MKRAYRLILQFPFGNAAEEAVWRAAQPAIWLRIAANESITVGQFACEFADRSRCASNTRELTISGSVDT